MGHNLYSQDAGFFTIENAGLDTSLLILLRCSPYEAVTGKIHRLKQQFLLPSYCLESLEGLLILYKLF